MADFFSVFWNWYIFFFVAGGIGGLVWLIRWQSTDDRKGKEAVTMGHVWDEDLAELNNPLPAWWLKLFYLTIAFAIAYLALYPGVFKGLLGWTQVGEYKAEVKAANAKFDPIYDKYLHQDIVALQSNPEAKKMGERLFLTYCTNCHGSDARGQPGFPNLTDNDWLHGGTPEKIEETITGGRDGTMPAWGPILGREGVFNVAEYVMSLSRQDVNQEAAEKGKAIFAQNCVGCHGVDAKGNQDIGAPNLTDHTWLYGGSQATIIKTITDGRNGHMPAHGEFLGKAKVHLLATYIYSLSHPQGAAATASTTADSKAK